MVDVRIKQNFDFANPLWDWLVRYDTHLLDEREELATAVRVALGTDALADEDEILPDPDSTNRRGWWGDMEAESIWEGWSIGTKNWLLIRAKITPAPSEEGDTIERARQYTLAALQPFIDRGVASRVEVEAARVELHRIDVHAIIYRGPREEIDLRYQLLWEELEPADVPVAEKIIPQYGIVVSSPVLGMPDLGTHYYFNTVLLNISPPVLSTAVFFKVIILPPANLVMSSPQLAVPTMYSANKLIVAAPLAVSSPVISRPLINQAPAHQLAGNELAVSTASLEAIPTLSAGLGFSFTEMFGINHPDQILIANMTLDPATQKLMKGGVEVPYQVVVDYEMTPLRFSTNVPQLSKPTLTINP